MRIPVLRQDAFLWWTPQLAYERELFESQAQHFPDWGGFHCVQGDDTSASNSRLGLLLCNFVVLSWTPMTEVFLEGMQKEKSEGPIGWLL